MTREQWQAIKNRDAAYDGRFVYALRSTRTICRPSCSAQKVDVKNVLVFDTVAEAEQRGFHPCRRCRPDLENWRGPQAELAEAARALIRAHYAKKFSLQKLAGALFVNKDYLSRVFKKITGETLLTFHNRTRCARAKELLTQMELSIAQVGMEVGYASPSHFTRIFKTFEGITPSEYRIAYLESLDR